MSFVVPSLPLTEAGPLFAVLLLVVLAAPLVSRRVPVPDVVVLVLAGVAVGPSGLGLLERDGAIEVLGAVGLLYLMFLAGLELDLDDFHSSRRDSLLFGALTFAVPIVLGTAVAWAIGLPILAAVLIGSCWSSHTLLAYPQFRRAGTAGHRAVATTVGATIITDTAALLVLVVVVRAHEGDLGPAFWLTLIPSFAAVVLATTLGLPRVARRFFAGPGQDGLLRLLFVLAALFVVASATALTGVEPIVGAFLAGLALNRSVPDGGVLMERVELLGSALLVPVFLVSTGMLVDLRLLLQPAVLGTGLAFVAVAMIAKLLAAVVAGRLLGHDRTAIVAMFSLSNAQAAATLAAIVVGLEAGLLPDGVVDAVVLVILVTCVVSSVVAGRIAARLRTVARTRPLGTVVVAPVVNPATGAGLLRLAAGIAGSDAGLVVPLVVAPTGSDDATIEDRRALLAEITTVAQSVGVEARPRLRIDATPSDGIVHTATEVEATLLVLGLQGAGSGGARIGAIVEEVLGTTQVPTLVVRDAGPVSRVVVVAGGRSARAESRPSLVLALRAGAAHVGRRGLPVALVTDVEDDEVTGLVTRHFGSAPARRDGHRPSTVIDTLEAGDLLVLPLPLGARHQRELATRVLRLAPPDVGVVLAVAHGRSIAAATIATDERAPRRTAGGSPGGSTGASETAARA